MTKDSEQVTPISVSPLREIHKTTTDNPSNKEAVKAAKEQAKQYVIEEAEETLTKQFGMVMQLKV